MTAKPEAGQLPEYAAALTAFHAAFGRELRRVVRAVPLPAGCRVLDVPCGDGFYTAALARRMYPFGTVVAADLSDAYLTEARRTVARCADVSAVEFVPADVYRMPFAAATFDVVWCAQSFISLNDPVAALKEMRRVLKPGGTVAVLEDDEFHRVVLNWPVSLELDVQRAVAEASREQYGTRSALSPGRRVYQYLGDAGFRRRRQRTFAADRQAPFPPAVRDYLQLYFKETREYAARHLAADRRAAFDRETDPADPASFLNRPAAELTCLTTLFLAEA